MERMIEQQVSDWKNIFSEFGIILESERIDRSLSFIFNPSVVTIITLPFNLMSVWLVFRKHNSSFKANSWYALYMIHGSFLFTVVYLAYLLPDKNIFATLAGFGFIVSITYRVFAAKKFYQLSWGKASWLTFLSLFILTPLYWGTSALLIFLVYTFS